MSSTALRTQVGAWQAGDNSVLESIARMLPQSICLFSAPTLYGPEARKWIMATRPVSVVHCRHRVDVLGTGITRRTPTARRGRAEQARIRVDHHYDHGHNDDHNQD
jgi:hypothetical protein